MQREKKETYCQVLEWSCLLDVDKSSLEVLQLLTNLRLGLLGLLNLFIAPKDVSCTLSRKCNVY